MDYRHGQVSSLDLGVFFRDRNSVQVRAEIQFLFRAFLQHDRWVVKLGNRIGKAPTPLWNLFLSRSSPLVPLKTSSLNLSLSFTRSSGRGCYLFVLFFNHIFRDHLTNHSIEIKIGDCWFRTKTAIPKSNFT